MPADEFTQAHFDALKACVEVADPAGDTMVDLNVKSIVDKALEALNVLVQHNPELGPLTEDDQALYDDFYAAMTVRVVDHSMIRPLLNRLGLRLKQSYT